MAQQTVLSAVTQFQADFADTACRYRPVRRRAVQRGQSFIVGKARHTQVPLRDAFHAENAAVTGSRKQRQTRTTLYIHQLINKRGNKRGLAAAAQSGNGKTKMTIQPPVDEGTQLILQSFHNSPV